MQFPLFRLDFFCLNFIQALNDVRSLLDSEKDNHRQQQSGKEFSGAMIEKRLRIACN